MIGSIRTRVLPIFCIRILVKRGNQMKRIFSNSNQVKCIFTDDGISFIGPKQEIFLPYGSLDGIRMSLLGVLQTASGSRFCSFAVDRKDRAEMKDMIEYTHKAMAEAPKAEARLTELHAGDRVAADLPDAEKLKQYKALFVQGIISKDELDAYKRLYKA